DGLEPDVLAHLDATGREVEDGLYPGGGQLLDHALRGLAGDGDDGELQVPQLCLARQVPQGEDRDAFHLLAPFRGVVVEDREDAEPLLGESLVVKERGPEIAEADEGDLPLAVEAEDPLQLRFQPRDVVPDAADAELTEVGQVLPDLRGVEAEALRKILR